MNNKIADIFREIAKILEILDENRFRIRAYERAAENIENLGEDLERLLEDDALTIIPGVGKDLEAKIKEIVHRGTCKYYQQLKKEIPQGVLSMLDIPGLGPKTVKRIFQELRIVTIAQLEKAAKSGKLQVLEGIKERTEKNILDGINLLRKQGKRMLLIDAQILAENIVNALKQVTVVRQIEAAGSLRRKKETVGDIDILVASSTPKEVITSFVNLPIVDKVLMQGETKASILTKEDLVQVDLRVVEEKSFGAALLYFTGSKDFNIKLRQVAIKEDYKVSEYGVFKVGKEKETYLAGKTEEEVFLKLGMDYVEPELREDRGEVEAALQKKLPKLVKLEDVKGDLHLHSSYSDGKASILEIANEVLKFGYVYVAVTDHSKRLTVAGGLSEKQVYQKIEEIKQLNRQFQNLRIFCGVEVEVFSDGTLDYSDELLSEFDVVVAAVHIGLKQSKKMMTKRMVKACENKHVNIIAHPTGRLWGVRESYQIDFSEVFKAAKNNCVALEINCHPHRLDLNDHLAQAAAKAGVKIALGSDAHSLTALKMIEQGINVARRAWLTKKDVINCLSLKEILAWLKK